VPSLPFRCQWPSQRTESGPPSSAPSILFAAGLLLGGCPADPVSSSGRPTLSGSSNAEKPSSGGEEPVTGDAGTVTEGADTVAEGEGTVTEGADTVTEGTVTSLSDSLSTGGDLSPSAVGTITLEDCRGLASSNEVCSLTTDATACIERPCPKLIVAFSGGEEGEVDPELLAGYVVEGWATAWINAFETPIASGAVPYLDEQARYDRAIREATTGAWARAHWSGEHLLFVGISHGATAPMVAIARTVLDEHVYWHGTGKTAGCFFDGSYDPSATAELLSTGAEGEQPCTLPVSYQRWLDRYCGRGPRAGDCELSTNPAALADAIVDVDPAQFAIRDLRLVECGSEREVCAGDVFPAGPIATLCSRIDADELRTCTYDSLPNLTHIACLRARGDDCRVWFDALPVP